MLDELKDAKPGVDIAVTSWGIYPHQIVAAGQPIVTLSITEKTPNFGIPQPFGTKQPMIFDKSGRLVPAQPKDETVVIRVPCAGKITRAAIFAPHVIGPATGALTLPAAEPLLTVKHYEGAAALDPFKDLRALIERWKKAKRPALPAPASYDDFSILDDVNWLLVGLILGLLALTALGIAAWHYWQPIGKFLAWLWAGTVMVFSFLVGVLILVTLGYLAWRIYVFIDDRWG